MAKSGVTAIIQHGYTTRSDYLDPIVESLANQTVPPDRIIIWNNTGWSVLVKDEYNCWIINSNENTLLGRYAAVLLAETKHVYIQDDDLIVGTDTIGLLLDRVDRGICGAFGCILGKGDYPYTTAKWETEGPVDVVLGRCFIAARTALIPGINYLLGGGRPPGRADDIMFSLMCPTQPYVMPGIQYQNLHEYGNGLSHEPQHMAERDEAAKYYLDGLNL